LIAKHDGSCPDHSYQDGIYGQGFRVMNPVRVDGKITGARCTVCAPTKEKGKKRGGIYSMNQLQIKR
jgi:hypothetical protein